VELIKFIIRLVVFVPVFFVFIALVLFFATIWVLAWPALVVADTMLAIVALPFVIIYTALASRRAFDDYLDGTAHCYKVIARCSLRAPISLNGAIPRYCCGCFLVQALATDTGRGRPPG
jgi:hypothetical protein